MLTGELGVAIHGAGWVATEHIRAYEKNPHTRIVAVGSRTKEGARSKAAEMGLDVPVFDNFEELLAHPGVDVVSLCTPPVRHSAETVLAAQAGKHILIEKPVATSVEELTRMRDAVRVAGVKTVVSFVLRWNPLVRNIKALKAEGLLGEIFHIETDYWHHLDPEILAYHGGRLSAMMAGGCHAMDAARYLMESDIVEVSARSWTPVELRDGDGSDARTPMNSHANNVAVVRFANGAMGKVSACMTQPMPYTFNIDLLGTEGAVRGDRFTSTKLPGLTGFARMETVNPDSGDVAHHPFQAEIDHFVDCIRNDRESHVSLFDAVNTHEACLAADLSAERGGAPIKLPLEGK